MKKLKAQKMKIILNTALTSLLLFAALNCSDNITGPVEPGKRDYTWTVDTLNSFNPVSRIWGSYPTDVWAITNGTYSEDIYHFDGARWTTGKYKLPDPYAPSSIYGFAQNNIYIGAQNRIYRFDGTGWKEDATLTKDGHSYDIVFDNMWGETLWGTLPIDLYAFGAYPDDKGLANKSVIAHLANNKWTMLNTDGLKGIVEKLYRNKTDQVVYMQVIKFSNTFDSTFIYEYDQGNYTKLYSTILDKYWATVSLIDNEVYFVLRTEIAKKVNNQFQTVLKLEDTNFRNDIWGRNSKDIFLEMTDGLAHYNGNDIEYLFNYNQYNNADIFDAALFEDDVFFLVYEFQTHLSLIYHGKLKE